MTVPAKFSFKAAGVSFAARYPDNLLALRDEWGSAGGIGEVSLIREPDNEYDANAIALLAAGEVVGHVPRNVAQFVAPMIDGGERLRASASVLVNPEHEDRPGLLRQVERAEET